MQEKIIVKGARTHNLKNVTVEMPRNKMVVFTGLSGSGKSSLAFDTIFAEGQRRYVESLSAYARQFLRQMQKPDVDEITGLSPAISIDQKSTSSNPRSTVATITEIYDYLRVLFARVGKPHCLSCGREIRKLSNEEIINLLTESVSKVDARKAGKGVFGVAYDDLVVRIYAPVVVGRKGEYYQLLYDLLSKGYAKVRIDGTTKNLRDRIELSRHKKHTVDALVDEIYLSEFKDNPLNTRERLGESIERALFETDGLVRIETPEMSEQKELVINDRLISAKFMCPYDGFSYPEVEPRLFSFNSPHGACSECNGLGTRHWFGYEPCPVCKGARLREEALHVFLGDDEGRRVNIVEVTALSVERALAFFKDLSISKTDKEIAAVVLKEIEHRLAFMDNVGIGYLTLGRRANTLSGGEAQRIRLASQLGSKLVGALYVLDEPTIGLHPHDNDQLVKTLHELRDLGNTIIVVEHDEDTIFSSDYLVDIGPGAGVHGGKVVVSGDMSEVLTDAKRHKSLTLDYLRGERAIDIPKERRMRDKGAVKIRGGKKFNIKNLNVDIPLGRLVAVTGVSGSGKSTFTYEILYKNLQARLERRYRSNETPNAASVTGTEYLSRVLLIDQSPIGRTPRSNPATYTGAFTYIRDLFRETEAARMRGWKPGRFSFNVPQSRGGGRCEVCEGNGVIAVEMHFLPTVYVTCDTCGGKRFQKDTLEVRYKKKNIYDVLAMTVEEAHAFFEDLPAAADRLKSLYDVGLGYLELGQSATTLSGGEAQRVKMAAELYHPHLTKTLYILDEPTVGLHYEDVRKLLEILHSLVAHGNTVLVIEHNTDIIKSADYVIDIGPGGGEAGGMIVAKGTPEEIAENKQSLTGKYLAKALGGSRPRPTSKKSAKAVKKKTASRRKKALAKAK